MFHSTWWQLTHCLNIMIINGGAILSYFRQPVFEQATAGREVDVQDSGAGIVTDALHILQTTVKPL